MIGAGIEIGLGPLAHIFCGKGPGQIGGPFSMRLRAGAVHGRTTGNPGLENPGSVCHVVIELIGGVR